MLFILCLAEGPSNNAGNHDCCMSDSLRLSGKVSDCHNNEGDICIPITNEIMELKNKKLIRYLVCGLNLK